MKRAVRSAFSFAALVALAACSDSQNTTYPTNQPRASANRAGVVIGFGFNSGAVTGLVPGVVVLTGGGSFDPATANNVVSDETVAHAGGGFSCIAGVDQNNFSGCATGQGVRWDTEQLLESTPFKCLPSETAKTAFTSDHLAVLQADFYRAGDANEESFKAKMIVADFDLDDLQDGVQNVWIQGVGCGTGSVNFSQLGRPFVVN